MLKFLIDNVEIFTYQFLKLNVGKFRRPWTFRQMMQSNAVVFTLIPFQAVRFYVSWMIFPDSLWQLDLKCKLYELHESVVTCSPLVCSSQILLLRTDFLNQVNPIEIDPILTEIDPVLTETYANNYEGAFISLALESNRPDA